MKTRKDAMRMIVAHLETILSLNDEHLVFNEEWVAGLEEWVVYINTQEIETVEQVFYNHNILEFPGGDNDKE